MSSQSDWPSPIKVAASQIIPLAIFIMLWQAAISTGFVDIELLPSPSAVLLSLVHLLQTRSFYVDIIATTGRSLFGLALGIIVGLPIGALMAVSKVSEQFFNPLIKATYSLPKTALVPLFMLWFGIGSTTNILAVMFSAVLPIVVYAYHGIQGTPRVLVWSARSMGTSEWEIMRLVRLPAAIHDIMTGVRIALGFSFVIAIAAEMIAAKIGAGKLIFMFGENGSYDYMFAALTAVVALACIADAAVVLLADQLLRWRDPDARRI
jgi:ABC-type nitrate/sulfonate/bicarbonate transport system permease component